MSTPISSGIHWISHLNKLGTLSTASTLPWCPQAARHLLNNPLLPRLHGIKCHILLTMANPNTLQAQRHAELAKQLWSQYALHWSLGDYPSMREEFEEIARCLDVIALRVGRETSSSSIITSRKRSVTQDADQRSLKRIKIEPVSGTVTPVKEIILSRSREQGADCDCDFDFCANDEIWIVDKEKRFSNQWPHGIHQEQEDVKFNPVHLDAVHEPQQTRWIDDSNLPIGVVIDTQTSAPGLVSPCWRPSSPARYPSSPPAIVLDSPTYYPSSPSTLKVGLPIQRYTGFIQPEAPRLAAPMTPRNKTPCPIFGSSPITTHTPQRYTHTTIQEVKDGLSLSNNDLINDINHIVPSTADDVFGSSAASQPSPSWLRKVKHGIDLSLCVESPASGPIAQYAVEVKEGVEFEAGRGYPCADHMFRTLEGGIIATWDDMGNIWDMEKVVVNGHLK
jgi:hypothetical protein